MIQLSPNLMPLVGQLSCIQHQPITITFWSDVKVSEISIGKTRNSNINITFGESIYLPVSAWGFLPNDRPGGANKLQIWLQVLWASVSNLKPRNNVKMNIAERVFWGFYHVTALMSYGSHASYAFQKHKIGPYNDRIKIKTSLT